MAFTTYTDTNRVVSNPLTTLFEFEYKGLIGATNRERWDITRTRTKSYEYVGLEESAVEGCVAYLNALWNRPFYDINAWTYDVSTGFSRPEVRTKELVAKITTKRDAGGVCIVAVLVDEVMQLPLDTSPLDYEIQGLQNLFTARIGTFDYDGETGI